MQLSINWRFFFISTGVAFMLLVGLHFFHGWQVKRQIGVFLREADAAKAANDPVREMEYVRRYVIAQPTDINQQERLALLMASNARTKKEQMNAFLALENVLQRDPSRTVLRRMAFEFALNKLRQLPEAKGHLTELLREFPNDGELEERMAFIFGMERKFTDASDWYLKAYTHKPDLLAAYAGRAVLLRERLNKPDEADDVIQPQDKKSGLLPANNANFRAHMLKADYGRKYKKPLWVVEGMTEARRLAPDNLDVILAVIDSIRDAARTAKTKADAEAKRVEARAEIDRGLKLHDKSVSLYLARASVEADASNPVAAAELLVTADKSLPDQLELLIPLASYQIDANNLTGASATLDRLTKLNVPITSSDFLRARILMAREEWSAAAKAFVSVRRAALNNPALVREAGLLLGRCYEQLGEADRQLEAFTQSLPDDLLDPAWGPAVYGQARAYAALGRPDDALGAYMKLANRGSAAAWAAVARLRIRKQLLRTVEQRNWDEVEEAIQMATSGTPDSIDVKLLRADLLAIQGKVKEAKAIVDALFKEQPKESTVWVAKAAADARDGSAADASKRLQEGRNVLGDPVELRLAEALYVEASDPDAGKKLLALAEGADKYGLTSRRVLFLGLAEAAGRVGANTAADRLWESVVKVQPDDLSAYMRQLVRAIQQDDEQKILEVENQIRRIDGDVGSSAKMAKAMRLVWQAQMKNDLGVLPEAIVLLTELEKETGRWNRVPFTKAIVLDMQGKSDEALTYYQKAVNGGDRSPEVLRRLMTLLYEKGRFADANKVLSDLPDASLATPDALRLAAEVSLRADDSPRRAMDLASKAIPPDSKRPQDYIWLGQLLTKAGDREGAGKAYLRARDLNPAEPNGWLLVVDFLVANDKLEEAKKQFEDGRKAVPADSAGLFTARGFALLGQSDEAAKAFAEVRKNRPDDQRVLRAEADFLTTTGQFEAARLAWGRVIDQKNTPGEDKQSAKQMLALCYAFDPDYEVARRALEVLGSDDGSGLKTGVAQGTSSERRTRALVLMARKDRASVLAAISLLEGADRLEANDLVLLAGLYQMVNNDAQVQKTMTKLISADERNLFYTVTYARWLIDHDNPKEAEPLVQKLEKRQPEAFSTIELRARVSAALDDRPSARIALKKLANQPKPQLLQIADLAEQAGLLPESEGYYKALASAMQKEKPEAAFPLAGFYARHGRLTEALSLLEVARKTVLAPVFGQACMELLAAAGEPPTKEMQKVAGWLDEALKVASKNADPSVNALANQLAYVRNLQGDYDSAVKLYEGLVAASKPDPVALNNLAYLRSAYQKRYEDALALLKRATNLVGPLPDLLDTEALVRLNRNEGDDAKIARELLLDVTSLAPSGAAFFHLSLAEEKLKNTLDSKAALANAQRRKLKQADLHPLEWGDFRRLVSK